MMKQQLMMQGGGGGKKKGRPTSDDYDVNNRSFWNRYHTIVKKMYNLFIFISCPTSRLLQEFDSSTASYRVDPVSHSMRQSLKVVVLDQPIVVLDQPICYATKSLLPLWIGVLEWAGWYHPTISSTALGIDRTRPPRPWFAGSAHS
jgi:hypothetical protein